MFCTTVFFSPCIRQILIPTIKCLWDYQDFAAQLDIHIVYLLTCCRIAKIYALVLVQCLLFICCVLCLCAMLTFQMFDNNRKEYLFTYSSFLFVPHNNRKNKKILLIFLKLLSLFFPYQKKRLFKNSTQEIQTNTFLSWELRAYFLFKLMCIYIFMPMQWYIGLKLK